MLEYLATDLGNSEKQTSKLFKGFHVDIVQLKGSETKFCYSL